MTERHAIDRDLLAHLLAAQRPRPVDARRSGALRLRVLQRAASTQATGHSVRADEGRWHVLQPGLAVKVLRRERDNLTALWRLDAGASIPAHAHRRDEECLVVSGDVCVGDASYGAGDYLLALSGSTHAEFTSRAGAVLLIRGEDPFAAAHHA